MVIIIHCHDIVVIVFITIIITKCVLAECSIYFNCNCGNLGDLNLYDIENTSIIFVIRYVLTGVVITFIN